MSFSRHHETPPQASRHQVSQEDWRLERLIDRLPARIGAMARRMRQPSGRRRRTLAGLLLIFGGTLGFLPLLGLWMLPLGLALLAEDIALLRTWRARLLDWIERRHPSWLGLPSGQHRSP